ncbi:hypothetical protein BRADI_3g28735v3 [Brachypodium distachyon]|uniref:Uncharacterized protein n=1 Tax=Brachypodium distachyon TaxID=15368 RepID=A0A2K2CZT4_BRADI|nr:hypothetical protein BRADI_3g28735v3 [Brachypodium distachyon]
MEVSRRLFHSPQPQPYRGLAELRIEADQSPVAFSDPFAAGRKRRCLFPATFSPRKKMLLELPPFSSALAPSTGLAATVSSSALSPYSGSNGSFAFRAFPGQPAAGPTRSRALAFLTSTEQPLTPMGSTASGGFGVLASRRSLSAGPGRSNGTGALAFLPSPTPARTGSSGKNCGELAFLASLNPAFGCTGSSASAAAAKELPPAGPGISGGGGLAVSPPLAFPVRNSEGSTLWSRRRGNKRPWEEQLQITLPLKKVAKTEASATGDSRRRASVPVSACCTFVNSPAKDASKQETKNNTIAVKDASRFSSPFKLPGGTCCAFVTSPMRPSAVEQAIGQNPTLVQERDAQMSGAGGDGRSSPAACPGAEMVVRVTCSCGAHKEFCFDHRH